MRPSERRRLPQEPGLGMNTDSLIPEPLLQSGSFICTPKLAKKSPLNPRTARPPNNNCISQIGFPKIHTRGGWRESVLPQSKTRLQTCLGIFAHLFLLAALVQERVTSSVWLLQPSGCTSIPKPAVPPQKCLNVHPVP